MLIVLPFCSKDAHQAKDLLRWMIQLDSKIPHDGLLVCDHATPYGVVFDILTLAKEYFQSVKLISNDAPVVGWPLGPNSLWIKAAEWAERNETAFFFLEPDAIPLCPGWLSALIGRYTEVGNPFMGAVLPCDKPGLPREHMNGVGFYPRNAYSLLQRQVRDSKLAFDISTAQDVVPYCTRTELIHVVWGENNNPPTFEPFALPGTNVFALNSIRSGAVLFHRNKDGTLIRLLQRKLGFSSFSSELLVVVPFCNHDGQKFFKNLMWWHELNDGQRHNYSCLLSYEDNTLPRLVMDMEKKASEIFRTVYTTHYGHGKPGEWMQTIAFRHAAQQVQLRFSQPWLWTEYDLVPLKKGWLDVILEEYRKGGHAFAGPIVVGMGHMNGTGVYPADTPDRIPIGINSTKTAWDVAMKKEMIHCCYDIGHVMFHCWGVVNGRLDPRMGDAPSFRDAKLFDQIPNKAVTFHRSKDGTLIDLLRHKRNGLGTT